MFWLGKLGGGWFLLFTRTGSNSRERREGEVITLGTVNTPGRQAPHVHSGVRHYLPRDGKGKLFFNTERKNAQILSVEFNVFGQLLCKYHAKQDVEHFHLPRKFPLALF